MLYFIVFLGAGYLLYELLISLTGGRTPGESKAPSEKNLEDESDMGFVPQNVDEIERDFEVVEDSVEDQELVNVSDNIHLDEPEELHVSQEDPPIVLEDEFVVHEEPPSPPVIIPEVEEIAPSQNDIVSEEPNNEESQEGSKPSELLIVKEEEKIQLQKTQVKAKILLGHPVSEEESALLLQDMPVDPMPDKIVKFLVEMEDHVTFDESVKGFSLFLETPFDENDKITLSLSEFDTFSDSSNFAEVEIINNILKKSDYCLKITTNISLIAGLPIVILAKDSEKKNVIIHITKEDSRYLNPGYYLIKY